MQVAPGTAACKPPHHWFIPGNALSPELRDRLPCAFLGQHKDCMVPSTRRMGGHGAGREQEQEKQQCYCSPFLIWHLQGSRALGAQEENQERAVLAGKAEVLHHHHLPSQHPSSWPFGQILLVKLQERIKQLN